MQLIEMLTRSLNMADESIEKIWAEESEKRYKALEEGRIQTIAFKDIIERYESMQIYLQNLRSLSLQMTHMHIMNYNYRVRQKIFK